MHRNSRSAIQQSVAVPAGSIMPAVPDYAAVKYLGHGGFGSVWMVRDQAGHLCALKVVRFSRRDRGYAFNREFSALKTYRPIADGHIGILRVLHIGRGSGFLYYTMQLADPVGRGLCIPARYVAKTLGAVLRQRRRIPVDLAVHFVLQVLDALGYIHKHGLIHRDIKPDNILFVRGQAMLGDISLIAEPETVKTTVGTVGYMPPGGCRTTADDLYSVGKMLYAVTTGYPPERYPDAPSRLDKRSTSCFPGINRVINDACCLRYKSAKGMADALRMAVATSTGRARVVTSTRGTGSRRLSGVRAEKGSANTEKRVRALEARIEKLLDMEAQRRKKGGTVARAGRAIASAASRATESASNAGEIVWEKAIGSAVAADHLRHRTVEIGRTAKKSLRRQGLRLARKGIEKATVALRPRKKSTTGRATLRVLRNLKRRLGI